MTATYLAIVILSVINVIIACINLYTTGRTDSIAERLDAINTRLNAQDKAIKGAYQSIEEERDCLFELNDDFKKLKKKAERTHLIALNLCNVVGKPVRKAIEAAEEREDKNAY